MYTQNAIKPKAADWQIILPLLILSLVPTLGGVTRIGSLVSGDVNPDNARFFAAPLPVIIHVVVSSLFCILGAFQFAPGLRKRNLELHRNVGRVLLVAGLLSGLTGLWMTVLYPLFPNLQGVILYLARVLVGVGMVVRLWLAWATIRQGRVSAHRAWMVRGYALGQGAGTQVLVFLLWTLLIGQPSDLTRDILMALAWLINVLFAEWVIQRKLA
jgi:uncharacterized membrane protein